MVEVFSAPLPDYPDVGAWHENPPGCLDAAVRLATGKLPFTEERIAERSRLSSKE
jgi:hypothetical protein